MREEKVVSFMALQYQLPALIMNDLVLQYLVRLINRIPTYACYIVMASAKFFNYHPNVLLLLDTP
jgi:hypothetical protein